MISPVHTWTAGTTGLTENLDQCSLSAWQMEHVKMLICHARKTTRFYRDLPENFDSIEDLPFTTPADISADPMAFLAIPPSQVERITTLSTSGTTGSRKRIFFSAGDLERIREFFSVGMQTLTRSGQRAQILISDDSVHSLGSLLREALDRIGVEARILSAIPGVKEAVEASRDADCIIGMPSELFYMCRKEPLLRPESILLTADYVPESVVSAIRNTWQCDVFTHYGMTETGFGFAVDCHHHQGYHTRDAGILTEIISPETGLPCPPGQPGEIVLTMFTNEAMPLIRYRTGDRSVFIPGVCPCRSGLRRLGRIESRFQDRIRVPEGGEITIRSLDEALFSIPSLHSFQAAWNATGEDHYLCLMIESSEKIDHAMIKTMLPPGLRIKVLHGTCDPFQFRGKRMLYRDNAHPAFNGHLPNCFSEDPADAKG